MDDYVMRRREVERRIGLSRSWLYAAMARGEFPRPTRLGRRAVGWKRSTIDQWLSNKEGQAL